MSCVALQHIGVGLRAWSGREMHWGKAQKDPPALSMGSSKVYLYHHRRVQVGRDLWSNPLNIFFFYCALVRLSYKCGSRSCRFRRKTANHQIHNKTISVSNTVCVSENLSKAQSQIKMELRLKRDLRNPSLILFFFFFPRISVSPQGGGSQYFSLKNLHLSHFVRPGTECSPFSMMDPSMLLCPMYKTRTQLVLLFGSYELDVFRKNLGNY